MDLSRSLSSFRIPPTLKNKLISSGFKTLKDLKDIGPVELSKGSLI